MTASKKHTNNCHKIIYTLITLLALTLAAPAEKPLEYDPARYIDLEELKVGMTGYGKTVFHGTKIEQFPVEIVSIMPQWEMKRKAILIKALDPRFALAKGVQGVSGSPVYFNDRLAGAMAFGWEFGEEPLYGVTPIREMLEVQRSAQTADKTAQTAAIFTRDDYAHLMAGELLTPARLNKINLACPLTRNTNNESENTYSFPTALCVSGLSPAALREFQNIFGPVNLLTTQAGGEQTSADFQLVPGATITVPLISGDLSGAVLGTVTEVRDGNVFAFGHGWNANGPASWPFAGGFVHTFVSRKSMSFKLGSPTQTIGTLLADEVAAIYGQIGPIPATIPVQVNINWKTLGTSDTYNINLAQNEQADPMLAAMSILTAIMQRGELPEDHTLNYSLTLEFDSLDPITCSNSISGTGIRPLLTEIIAPVALTLGNPWQKVKLTAIKAECEIAYEDTTCYIRHAETSREIFYPGQTIPITLELEPKRAPSFNQTIEFTLPQDLEPGRYSITIGSADEYRDMVQSIQPHRYLIYQANDIVKALNERLNVPRKQIYAIMPIQKTGIALENKPLPQLPTSKMMLLTSKARPMETTRFNEFQTQTQTLNYTLMGSQNLEFTVRKP